MVDYERLFAKDPAACGAHPFPEVAAFLQALPAQEPPLRILDVGCGQGRDALFAARLGHVVHGLDVAPAGVRQMLEQGRRDGLAVTGEAVDVTRYAFTFGWDVVLIDRVLHCLPEATRRGVLNAAASSVVPGGFLMVVEPPSGTAMLEQWLTSSTRWVQLPVRRGFLLAQAVG